MIKITLLTFGLLYLLMDVWLVGLLVQGVHIDYQVVLVFLALTKILHKVFVAQGHFDLVNYTALAVIDVP